jgi:hypothetical protein
MVSPKPSMLEKITHHQRGNSFGAVQEAVSPRESSNALDALVQVDSSPPVRICTTCYITSSLKIDEINGH